MKKNSEKWTYSSINNLEFSLRNGQANLCWRDEEKNMILEGKFKDIVFFKQSIDTLGGYELILAYELSIKKINSCNIINYLNQLGYQGASLSFPDMFHLHVESDVMVDIICKDVSIDRVDSFSFCTKNA